MEIRSHPALILLPASIKIAPVTSLGPHTVAIVVAEILPNATSMFNHSSIKIAEQLDRVIWRFIVTPDMHRVHHSTDEIEHNRNFGFNFPWWDRMLGTYQAQPQQGHNHMEIGISGFRDRDTSSIVGLLLQSLRSKLRP